MSLENEKLPSQPESQQRLSFEDASLAAFKSEVLVRPLPKGYPPVSERLVLPVIATDAQDRVDLLGHGSWSAGQQIPTESEYEAIKHLDFATDLLGRPIHPWLGKMISDPDLGVVTGKGVYYNWGPNQAADAVIIHNGHVLLVVRNDGGIALPGGFVDAGEKSETTAPRETKEETGVIIPENVKPVLIYNDTVADIRMTANAWSVTTAYLYELDSSSPQPELHPDYSEIKDAFWMPIEEARQTKLYGSHSQILELACYERDSYSYI